MKGKFERMIVTLAVIASFTILEALGKMTTQILDVYGPIMGVISIAWFQAHQSAMRLENQSDTVNKAMTSVSKVLDSVSTDTAAKSGVGLGSGMSGRS